MPEIGLPIFNKKKATNGKKVTKSQPKKSFRQVKHFSEAIKRQTVKDIEHGKCSELEASKELLVSQTAIYKWVYNYS